MMIVAENGAESRTVRISPGPNIDNDHFACEFIDIVERNDRIEANHPHSTGARFACVERIISEVKF